MVEFQVEGMSCNHCIAKVTRSVKKLDAAARVEVDLVAQRVRVGSTAADADDIAAALDEAGYPATHQAAS